MMTDVSKMLDLIAQGDALASEQLLPLVYDELRKLAAVRLANEKPGQTLQATALVHEAYLRLVGNNTSTKWSGQGHFFGAAAEAMRRILIENARSKGRIKRGGDMAQVDLDRIDLATCIRPDQLLALDEAIEALAAEDETAAQLVKLRYFAGLSIEQAAVVLEIASSTAYRHWNYARAWMRCELLQDEK